MSEASNSLSFAPSCATCAICATCATCTCCICTCAIRDRNEIKNLYSWFESEFANTSSDPRLKMQKWVCLQFLDVAPELLRPCCMRISLKDGIRRIILKDGIKTQLSVPLRDCQELDLVQRHLYENVTKKYKSLLMELTKVEHLTISIVQMLKVWAKCCKLQQSGFAKNFSVRKLCCALCIKASDSKWSHFSQNNQCWRNKLVIKRSVLPLLRLHWIVTEDKGCEFKRYKILELSSYKFTH